jgi:hypothetical protein
MPVKMSPELTQKLYDDGIRYIVVGHTPHGAHPTVILNEGIVDNEEVCLPFIMCDTSFSDASAPDCRGIAVNELTIENGVGSVSGISKNHRVEYTIRTDQTNNHFLGQVLEDGRFVKATNPDGSRIVTKIEGTKHTNELIQ